MKMANRFIKNDSPLRGKWQTALLKMTRHFELNELITL